MNKYSTLGIMKAGALEGVDKIAYDVYYEQNKPYNTCQGANTLVHV